MGDMTSLGFWKGVAYILWDCAQWVEFEIKREMLALYEYNLS